MIWRPGFKVALSADIPLKARYWRNDEAIQRWCRQYTVISEPSQKRWLERIEVDDSIKMFGVVEKGTRADVGTCGLTSIDRVNQRAEFSLYIAPEYQRKGYGLEALRTLVHHGFYAFNLVRIWGEVFDGNLAIEMFKKVGFQKEGTLRSSYFREGRFIDSHIVSLLRGEECMS